MNQPGEPSKLVAHVLLCHGAGAGSESEFMQALAAELRRFPLKVTLLDFPYMQRMQAENRKLPPDRMPKLLAFLQTQVEQQQGELPLILAGKSMGSRVASHISVDSGLPCIAYGYPFHPPGKPDKLRTEHLLQMQRPMLILQGERDPFGKAAEIPGFNLSNQIQVEILSSGEHSFKPLKTSGLTQMDLIQHAAQQSWVFIQSQISKDDDAMA